MYIYIYVCVCVYIYMCVYIYITIILYRITYYVYHVSLPWTKQLAFPTFSPPLAHPGRVVRQVSWSLAPWGPRNARGRRSLRGWSRRATSPAMSNGGKIMGKHPRFEMINGVVKGKIYRKPWFLPSNIGCSCKFSHHPILWNDGSHNVNPGLINPVYGCWIGGIP